MKTKDIIRPFERSLLVQFGNTGELQQLSTLRLDQGVTFTRAGNAIEARYHDGAGAAFVVERFASEPLAATAFRHLQAALERYARVRRIAGRWKAVVRWGVAPVVVVVFALAANMAATHAIGGSAAGSVAVGVAAPMVVPSKFVVAPPPVAAPAELARAMADGARSGKYAVLFAKGTKGTLYVFSDPSCPHCQDLEPELDKLAKIGFTIHLFPVTVIGGEVSRHRTAKLMCAKPEARVASWKRIIQDNDLPNAECPEGADAIARNDQMFRVMRFPGTPAIINGAGEQTPDSIPNTADAISHWMSTAVTASR